MIAVGSPGSGGSVMTDGSRGNARGHGLVVVVGVPVPVIDVLGVSVSAVVVVVVSSFVGR